MNLPKILIFVSANSEKDFSKVFKGFSKCVEYLHLIKSGYREAGYKLNWNCIDYYSIKPNDSDENTIEFFIQSSAILNCSILLLKDGIFYLPNSEKVVIEIDQISEY